MNRAECASLCQPFSIVLHQSFCDRSKYLILTKQTGGCFVSFGFQAVVVDLKSPLVSIFSSDFALLSIPCILEWVILIVDFVSDCQDSASEKEGYGFCGIYEERSNTGASLTGSAIPGVCGKPVGWIGAQTSCGTTAKDGGTFPGGFPYNCDLATRHGTIKQVRFLAPGPTSSTTTHDQPYICMHNNSGSAEVVPARLYKAYRN